MAEELRLIAENPPPDQTWNSNAKAAEYLRTQMETASGDKKLMLRYLYAEQLLNAGQTNRAITEFTSVISDLQRMGIGLQADTKKMYEMLAVAYLRLGEEDNCTNQHNPNSCIIPVAPDAVHTLRAGAENAIGIYTQILNAWPDDTQSRYLLNLAYMILGDYPEKVPEQYLIENLGKSSATSGIRRFRDVAIQSNSDILGLSGGVCFDDFNNDGLIDIVASSWGLKDQLRYLINEGNGRFRDHTIEAGLEGITSGLNMVHADYDNDGDLDVLVLRGAWLNKAGNHPNSLLRNNGDDTFTDVTREAGIYSRHPTQAAVWADFNLDGHLDIFIANESNNEQRHPCELYINNGSGVFKEVGESAGVSYGAFMKGAASGDINNDGRPDLYISSLGTQNVLLLNKGVSATGIPVFENIAPRTGTEMPKQSFPCWFWDYNQDGWDDLFVASYDLKGFQNLAGQFGAELLGLESGAESSRLYLNNKNSTFTDVTRKAGLNKVMSAMGSNFGDLNNDGYPDFYIGNGAPDLRMVIPNRMFLNRDGQSFEEVTYDGGFGHIQKGHAVAFGDCDNDGDQDIYCVIGGAAEGDVYYNLLFENPGTANAWISLKLQGTVSNRSAIGARVIVKGTSRDGRSITRYRTVNSGGSFGASSLRLEIGLGEMATINNVEVNWPNGVKELEVFKGLEVNKAYNLIEGSGTPEELQLPTFRFEDPV